MFDKFLSYFITYVAEVNLGTVVSKFTPLPFDSNGIDTAVSWCSSGPLIARRTDRSSFSVWSRPARGPSVSVGSVATVQSIRASESDDTRMTLQLRTVILRCIAKVPRVNDTITTSHLTKITTLLKLFIKLNQLNWKFLHRHLNVKFNV